MTNEEKNDLSKEVKALDNAAAIIDEYNNGQIPNGLYAYNLITETHVNLLSQSISGQLLHVEGQQLDLKVESPHKIPNTNKYITGYRIGKFSINYTQKTCAFGCDYDKDEKLIITDGFLIQEQLYNPDNSIGNVIYDGNFEDITMEGLSILELCMKFSALNYDMFFDKDLLKKFSSAIKQTNISINDLPLLNDKKMKS